MLDDRFERLRRLLLRDVPVLMEAVLRVAVELQIHGNVDVFQHDRLEDLDPGPRLLRREDVVQDLQRALLVADGRELVRALERILGFLCEER